MTEFSMNLYQPCKVRATIVYDKRIEIVASDSVGNDVFLKMDRHEAGRLYRSLGEKLEELENDKCVHGFKDGLPHTSCGYIALLADKFARCKYCGREVKD